MKEFGEDSTVAVLGSWWDASPSLTSLNLKLKFFVRRRSPCGSWKV